MSDHFVCLAWYAFSVFKSFVLWVLVCVCYVSDLFYSSWVLGKKIQLKVCTKLLVKDANWLKKRHKQHLESKLRYFSINCIPLLHMPDYQFLIPLKCFASSYWKIEMWTNKIMQMQYIKIGWYLFCEDGNPSLEKFQNKMFNLKMWRLNRYAKKQALH